MGSRLAASFAGPAAGRRVEAAVRSELPQTVLREWRAAVAEHLTAHPYTAAEQAALDTAGDGPEIPYGSTLLLAATWSHWLACAQIGDGDMLAVCPDGRSFAPVPPGALPAGPRTTSLCQPDALDAFRVGVRDLDQEEILALLLATDGYGNSQVADPWQPEFGRDLAKLAAERDHHWFARQVPRWGRRGASADGSGVDTTAAPPGRHGHGRAGRGRGRAAAAAGTAGTRHRSAYRPRADPAHRRCADGGRPEAIA